jgi:hypothetical protein
MSLYAVVLCVRLTHPDPTTGVTEPPCGPTSFHERFETIAACRAYMDALGIYDRRDEQGRYFLPDITQGKAVSWNECQLTDQSSPISAQAQSKKCNAPPYGDTETAYKEFAHRSQALVLRVGESFLPTKVLPPICRAKFEGADRTPFYNLGFTDRDFETKSTTEFATQWVLAVMDLIRNAPAPN